MKNLKTFLMVIAACVLAIASKLILPSEVNAQNFDSLLVLKFGFPAAATLYFIMIYSQNAFVTKWFAKKSELSEVKCGLRFGLCFGLIYLAGMQEVVVESSPFAEWGIEFVIYQLAMGAGEAVMAFLLCLCVSRFASEKKSVSKDKKMNLPAWKKICTTLLIALAFFAERVILYKTGFISSDINTFPAASYLWTFIFGLVTGICFCLLYPVFAYEKNCALLCVKICFVSIGLCWIGFNLFIVFIFKDSISDVSRRCAFDLAVYFTASLISCRIFKLNEK